MIHMQDQKARQLGIENDNKLILFATDSKIKHAKHVKPIKK